MTFIHPAQLPSTELSARCEMTTGRRGGPGGQHRNKVETAVILREPNSGISAEANERRSQAYNRRIALDRLRVRLAIEVRSDAAYPVSQLWKKRSGGGKLNVSSQHEDFPALLSELLDRMYLDSFNLSSTAEHFSTSSAQLLKLLRTSPAALASVNLSRAELGLHPLR